MPKSSGYFEEATELFADADSFVSLTTQALYHHSFAQYRDKKLIPLDGFSILYFFQSSIRALLKESPNVVLTSVKFPYPWEPIKATNWPDGLQKWALNRNTELLSTYLDLVRDDSDPAGDDFDVSYAVGTLALAFDNREGNKRSADSYDMRNLDGWLSGFNRDP